jgi:hypothetical protein
VGRTFVSISCSAWSACGATGRLAWPAIKTMPR